MIPQFPELLGTTVAEVLCGESAGRTAPELIWARLREVHMFEHMSQHMFEHMSKRMSRCGWLRR